MELKRDVLDTMIAWKTKRNRKPMLLQGARQVGKTWLLKKLGKQVFDNCVIVNIDREPVIADIFAKTKDPHRIIEQIALIKGQPIQPEKTLLVLDEIQDSDEVLNALKYFNEDAPEYAVACAGSLLGVALRRKGHSFPVGQVDFMTLYPLTFIEFLEATDARLASIVRSCKTDDLLPEMLREELQDKLKLYMLVGGMPEAVTGWVETGDIREVDKTLDGILRAYPLDFSKYATAAEVIRINRVWNSMQRQLARDNKRFKYSDVQKGARAREYETSVDWLCKAGLVHKVCNTETIRLPLMAYKDENAFKLYLNDVGLLRRMFNLESTSVLQDSRLFMEFKGVLTENYVLMSILCQGYEPLYWTSGNQAEVEFVIEDTGRIIPIEVKSKESIQSKSLSEYRKKFIPELAIRCSQKNLQIRDGLLNLPLPLAGRMKDYVKTTPGDIIEYRPDDIVK